LASIVTPPPSPRVRRQNLDAARPPPPAPRRRSSASTKQMFYPVHMLLLGCFSEGWMIILLPFMMLELEKKMLAIEKKRLQMDAEKKEKAGRALTGEAAGTPEKGSEREQGEQRPVTAEQGHAEPSRGGAGAGARPAEQGQRRRRGTRRTP
ncbi:hypothetical protein EJB05_35675, partial [Eragrostis curvula]